jgi:hypothetical protein
MKYSEQLKTPEWKAKREAIVERDLKKCVRCDSKKSLQVHHLYYDLSCNAWEYPDTALVTLCKTCHEKEHGVKQSKKAPEIFIKAFLKEWLAVKPGLTGLENLILMCLMDGMDMCNEIKFTPKKVQALADLIKTTKKSVQTTFYKLMKRKERIVIKTDEYEYMVNPNFGVKHKTPSYIDSLFKLHSLGNDVEIDQMRKKIKKYSKYTSKY